ncbi:MAG: hypothetical protein ACR2HJ_01765 [Fimbriimonadales bacterium]
MAALLACIALIAGCYEPADRHLVIVIDVSDQSLERLVRYAQLGFKAQRKAPEVTIISYGNDADIVYEGPGLRDRGKFNAALKEALTKPRPGIAKDGTRHARALRLAFRSVSNSSSRASLLVLTDGGEEWVEGDLETVISGGQRIKNLDRVAVLGVLPEHRVTFAKHFAAFGERANVRSLADADLALLEVAAK